MADYRFPGEWIKDGMVLEENVTSETISRLESFEMLQGDVLVATYPKTGTTWLQELVWLVCNNGDTRKSRSVNLNGRIPFLEYKMGGGESGLEMLQTKSPPHLMMTHLRSDTFRTQIEAGKVNIVIGIRNPKDTLVSFYHFYRMNRSLGNFKGSWDDFFELHKAKHILCGDYFRWYSSWLQYKDKPNVLLVKYEDMHRRMPDVIKDVSNFLGKKLPQNIIDGIVQHLSFDNMSKNNTVNRSIMATFDNKISPFLRKGKVGDWKNYFSKEQSDAVDKSYKDIIEPFGVTLSFE
ncbi:hypothetical protein LSH36_155g06023 [Paralvinella palmiformis]|uniref:Sulfotransferase domain-containing protein n=1 Tax=Paralvinella palmiformis TaxID=53620 RepID=A0AAD9N6U4_9ANNE|nr:hypothetical protein LSH36_155g06023 [Paralvinella palmiformis]